MKTMRLTVALLVMAGAGALALGIVQSAKLPKCSGQLCHDNCSPEILCAKGTKVITCADYCSGN